MTESGVCGPVGEILGASSAGLLVNNLHRFGLDSRLPKDSSAKAVLEQLEKAQLAKANQP